jgi:hypothetical protein
MPSPSYTQLGDSATAANNVVLRCNDDGTFSVCYGDVGAETEKFKLNADGSLALAVSKSPWTLVAITATDASWAVPSGTTQMLIEGWGGGASGGGTSTGAATTRGCGGGAGAYFKKLYSGTMDATLNVTIGIGGTVVTGNNTGTSGGTTSVVGTNLGTLSAGPGVGGTAGPGAGGAGGTATGGDENISGGAGGAQPGLTNTFGVGGNSPRGGMGGVTNVAAVGGIPGGGGSGENHAGGSSGAGARGQVNIWTR